MQPELWEATDGYVRELPAYEQKESSTAVPLKLEPFESVFVVFRKPAGKASVNGIAANYPLPATLADLKGPWTVNFNASQRGPEEPIVFETLRDWSTSVDDRIKYYSGTALYHCKFKLEKLPLNQKVIVNLGKVIAIAKVTVNDKYAGGVWTAPYRLDITGLVREGENELTVEVVNTWVNRLIGDSKLPVENRLTWSPYNPYTPTSPMQPSGLLGPVYIRSQQ